MFLIYMHNSVTGILASISSGRRTDKIDTNRLLLNNVSNHIDTLPVSMRSNLESDDVLELIDDSVEATTILSEASGLVWHVRK